MAEKPNYLSLNTPNASGQSSEIKSLIGASLNQQFMIADQQMRLGLLWLYNNACDTDDIIKLDRDYGYMPFINTDERIIPVYEFVEALDEIIDYDQIRDIFPTISYAGINAAMEFIRKISQFNIGLVDVDEILIDQEIECLSSELTDALNDDGVERVLNFD